jgi:hypothetical protein
MRMNTNVLSGMAVLSYILASVMYYVRKGIPTTVLASLSLVVAIWIPIFNATRGAFTILGICVVQQLWRGRHYALLAISIVFGFLAYEINLFDTEAVGAFLDRVQNSNYQEEGRWQSLLDEWQKFSSRPVWGTGHSISPYGDSVNHMFYVNILTDYGIVGFVACGVWLFSMMRLKRVINDSASMVLLSFLLASLVFAPPYLLFSFALGALHYCSNNNYRLQPTVGPKPNGPGRRPLPETLHRENQRVLS